MQTTAEAILHALRLATEDDVARAMDGAYVDELGTPGERLKFFNRMVDVRPLGGAEEGASWDN